MSEEKTLESVESGDEKKETDESEVHSQEETEEEQVEETVEETGKEEEEKEEPEKEKTFKTREERAEFFKKKQKEESKKDDDVVTKSDLYKINERKAIKDMTTPLESDTDEMKDLKSFINNHWSDLVPYYNTSIDSSDVDAIKEGILDATAVLQRRTGTTVSANIDTEARSSLMTDGGTKGSSGKGAPAEKKSVLGTPSKGMDDWYPSKDN